MFFEFMRSVQALSRLPEGRHLVSWDYVLKVKKDRFELLSIDHKYNEKTLFTVYPNLDPSELPEKALYSFVSENLVCYRPDAEKIKCTDTLYNINDLSDDALFQMSTIHDSALVDASKCIRDIHMDLLPDAFDVYFENNFNLSSPKEILDPVLEHLRVMIELKL